MKIASEFSASAWRVCWATTYTFEPAFFEAFLLRRLGDPPLNVTILGDARMLERTWAELGVHDVWRVPGLNRRYLVRGVALDRGAFHAKTILLGRDKRGILLVGSGNLGIGGLESGHEVFAKLESDAEPAAFAAWREWMGAMVAGSGDRLLRERWADALGRLPWLVGADRGKSAFVTSWRRSLLDQFTAELSGPVDELHATAPFFDHDLFALRTLVDRVRPRSLVLYLGRDTSVDGPRLLESLRGMDCAVQVKSYVSAQGSNPVYVHAKMVATIAEQESLVLAGSANLSRPALLATAEEANVEAGVIRRMGAESARSLFSDGQDLAVADLTLDDVRAFVLSKTSDGGSFEVRLSSATRQPDGSVVFASTPVPVPGSHLTDGIVTAAVVGTRTERFEVEDGVHLVWLVAPDGGVLSNRVPLEDPAELARALAVSASGASDRPRELDDLNRNHPLYRILCELHQSAVFDVDDTPARSLVESRRSDEDDADTQEFWDRYFEDELGRDPRAKRYSLGTLDFGHGIFLDDFAALLQQMLNRVPAPHGLSLLGPPETETEESDQTRPGYRWTTPQRLRVRAFNVLARWVAAIADPRLRWFGELAPVRHYVALISALAQIWPHAGGAEDDELWLRSDQLSRLAESLFAAFVRSERGRGYLSGFEEALRGNVITSLRECGATSMAAAIAYRSLYRAKPETFFAWQPFLLPALEWGVMEPDERAAALAEEWLGGIVTAESMGTALHTAATYIDDEHWCAQAATEWGLRSIELKRSGNPHVPWDLIVAGASSLLHDPRLVGLVGAALAYRHTSAIRARLDGDLLVVAIGRTIIGHAGDKGFESELPLFREDLDELISAGAGFGTLLAEVAAAS
jgi:hypothetical protein